MWGTRSNRFASTVLAVSLFSLFQLFATLLAAQAPAHAAVCGDDVDGRRIGCACGDVVVSNTALRTGDPILNGRCESDGLIVRAPYIAEGITIDLGGHALVGSGFGRGIVIEHGGADGAEIIGGTAEQAGQVVGFDVGVSVPHSDGVGRIEHLIARGNRRDGFQIVTSGAILIDLVAESNGGYGIRMRGRGGRIIESVARNNKMSGARIDCRDTIIDIEASANAKHGVIVDGRYNDLSKVRSSDNEGHGVIVRGGSNRLEGLKATGNRGVSVWRKTLEPGP